MYLFLSWDKETGSPNRVFTSQSNPSVSQPGWWAYTRAWHVQGSSGTWTQDFSHMGSLVLPLHKHLVPFIFIFNLRLRASDHIKWTQSDEAYWRGKMQSHLRKQACQTQSLWISQAQAQSTRWLKDLGKTDCVMSSSLHRIHNKVSQMNILILCSLCDAKGKNIRNCKGTWGWNTEGRGW